MTRLHPVAVVMLYLLPLDAMAQRDIRSVTASITVTAYVEPVLTVEAIASAPVMLDASGPVADVLTVRANVSHRVVVRPAGGEPVALRVVPGHWMDATASSPLQFSGALGITAHRIECRGSAGACSFTFELESTDAEFPLRTTTGFRRGGTAASSSRIATTS